MKNRYYTNYIIFSIVFFLFIFSFSTYNLSQKYKHGSEKGLILFNRIKNNITTQYLSDNDFSSTLFKKNMNDFFNSDKSLQSLAISDNNGKMEYLYVKNPLILSKKPVFTNDFITKPEYKFNKFCFNLYSTSVIIPGSKTLNIEAVYRVIGYYEISSLIKIIIICLLVYIILTAFFLLFVPCETINTVPEKTESKQKKDNDDDDAPAQDTLEQDSSMTIKYAPLIKEINETIKNENLKKEQPLSVSDRAEETPASPNIPEELDTVADEVIKVDEKTGLADTEYFTPKLTYELEKAASNDTDLSLLFLSFISEDNNKITMFYDNLPLLLRSFFMPQMSFNFGKNKLAIIIPDKTIEESIKKTDEFIIRLKNISAIENIYAGLTSRNSRIVSSERFIKEAEGAVAKASSGSDHVVAFKSDPEKYREMIANQKLF